MGPGENATPEENELAYDLGKAIASEGWITLTGGRSFGVMDASMKGASEVGGLTIGILPGDNDQNSSEHAQIKICHQHGKRPELYQRALKPSGSGAWYGRWHSV